MKFEELFNTVKPLIACIHLMALPGSPVFRLYAEVTTRPCGKRRSSSDTH